MADQSIKRTVKNPKLTLMAFQLRNNLALGDEPVETADHLWKKCQELGERLNYPQLETLINRLDQHQEKIGFPPGEDDISNDYVELLKVVAVNYKDTWIWIASYIDVDPAKLFKLMRSHDDEYDPR